MKVGSPPVVRRTSWALRSASTRRPRASSAAPGLVGEGQGDARRLGDPRHRHRVFEADLAGVERPRDGGRGAVVRRRGERDVALAAEQSGGGVEADPARARQVDLGPGMQVGEVVPRAERARHGVDVGLELDQVAGHEAGRQPEAAQDVHHQPGRVAARAGLQRERLFGLLGPGLQADDVGDLLGQALVDVDQHVDRPLRLARHRVDEGLYLGCRRRRVEVGGDLRPRLGVVGEGEGLGRRLDEEVERVDHRHLGREVHLDPQAVGLLEEDQPGEPVAVRVLLPVDEMIGRRHLQRIAGDLRPAVRRGPQTDHLRPERDGPVVVIVRHVVDRGAHRHRGLLRRLSWGEICRLACGGAYGPHPSASTTRRAEIMGLALDARATPTGNPGARWRTRPSHAPKAASWRFGWRSQRPARPRR